MPRDITPTTGSPRSASAGSSPTTHPVPDLVVVSHLRWSWVWQRPQHLVSRFAAARAERGAFTWYVEEPLAASVERPTVRYQQHDGIIRVWLEVPTSGSPDGLGFDAAEASAYPALLAGLMHGQDRPPHPDVLLYTPMAYPLAESLRPDRLLYDVMDDLSSFHNAPSGLRFHQQRLLAEADVVFAGGRSLYRSVLLHRSADCHLFPSGVETRHYASAKMMRTPRRRKVAGYVGVIDERLDLDLIAGLAAALPDWTVRIVGPVTKIDPASLPQAANISYPGQIAYDDLPEVMAGFDVALMPFALNEATKSISPTKTLEYLAAGLPVVSTRVPDVVSDYTGVVHLADTATQFAEGCREVVNDPLSEREHRIRHIKKRQEWDSIAAAMHELMRPASTASAVRDTQEVSA